MKVKLVLLLLCAANSVLAQTNQTFVIQGTMRVDSLRNANQTVKKVYLTHEVNGTEEVVDSALVTDKAFSFRGTAPKHVEPYHISGFDNGTIQVFLEPGTITILPFDARFPVGAQVKGTAANDVFLAYREQSEANIQKGRARMEQALAALPAEKRNDDKAFYPYQRSVYYANSLSHRVAAMQFVAQHLNSPVALYIIKYDLFRFFTPKELEQTFLKAVPPALQTHPMYMELVNQLRAANLAEGKPAPDIEGQTPEGKTLRLSDLRGKYVLVDFWASWCAPCRREFPVVKQALQEAEGSVPFEVLSYSIDSKKSEWTACIVKNGLAQPRWHHISTLKGWGSSAAQLYHVEAVPRTVLIDPQGNIMAFDLRGEQLINTIRKLKSGALKPQTTSAEAGDDFMFAVKDGEPQMADTLYQHYTALSVASEQQVARACEDLKRSKGAIYFASAAGRNEVMRLQVIGHINSMAEQLQFLLNHNDWALMPLLVQRDFLPRFNKEYGRLFVNAMAPEIQSTPYAQQLDNCVKALNLMQGNDVPDVTLTLADGSQKQLSQYRGQYVLLTFWASWCHVCREEMPRLKQLYDAAQHGKEKLSLVSISIDKELSAWRQALKTWQIDLPYWVQAHDDAAAPLSAAKLFGVKDVPMHVLITPDGKVISLTLQGEELQKRVKQILDGDLYYESETPKK